MKTEIHCTLLVPSGGELRSEEISELGANTAPNSQRLHCEMLRARPWGLQMCKRFMWKATTASCKRKLKLLQGDERAGAGREALQVLHCSRPSEASAPGSSRERHIPQRETQRGLGGKLCGGFSTPHKTVFLLLFGGFATQALTQAFFPFLASRSGLC